MSKLLVMLVGSAAAALSLPAVAQPATTTQSWEGAVHEMQIRGPHSTIHGPLSDGRIVVTPGYRRYVRYHHHPRYYGRYYGMAR